MTGASLTNDTHARGRRRAQMSQSHATSPLSCRSWNKSEEGVRLETGGVDGFLSPPVHAAFSVSVDVNVLLLMQR